jgi:hypothetical protein
MEAAKSGRPSKDEKHLVESIKKGRVTSPDVRIWQLALLRD